MKRSLLLVVFVVIVAASALPQAGAQDGGEVSCPVLVQMAYEATQNVCDGLGRDEACYGNVNIEASFQADAENLPFETPGDTVQLTALESLQLSSMNTTEQIWGISLLHVRADLPEDDPTQNVEVLLFGNVEITQAPAESAVPVVLTITPAENNINIRSAASTSDSIITTLLHGQSLTADGRNEAGDWLRVQLADGTGTGWVFAELVTTDGDISNLPVVDNASSTTTSETVLSYGPMQAFYFTSGLHDRPCAEAPDSGLLIQTPQGAGKITFLINEVNIDLGSTVYLQAQPGGEMTVYVLEGQVDVTAQGVTVTAPAGTQVRIPLDANGLAAGAPIGPEPYDDAALQMLPLLLLSQPITIAPPAEPVAVAPGANPLTPSTGYWSSTITENRAGITANGACFVPGDPVGYETFVSVELADDGSIMLRQTAPLRTLTLQQVQPGVYQSEYVPETMPPDVDTISFERVTVVSPQEMTWEHGFAIRKADGDICDPTVVQSLAYAGETEPSRGEPPLTPGAWEIVVADLQGSVINGQDVCSVLADTGLLSGINSSTIGSRLSPPDTSTSTRGLEIDADGFLAVDGYIMAWDEATGTYTFGSEATGGYRFQIDTLQHFTGTYSFSIDVPEISDEPLECHVSLEGNLLQPSLLATLGERQPVDLSFVPRSGNWTVQITEAEINDVEACTDEVLTAPELGQEAVYQLEVSEDGSEVKMYNTVNGALFSEYLRGDSGYYVDTFTTTLSRIMVMTASNQLTIEYERIVGFCSLNVVMEGTFSD